MTITTLDLTQRISDEAQKSTQPTDSTTTPADPLPSVCGHLWWLSLVLSEIFLLSWVVIILQPSDQAVLKHLTLSALLPVVLFVFLHILVQKHQQRPVTHPQLRRSVAELGWVLKALTWLEDLTSPTLKWLFSRQYFAWILFFATSTAAICGALQHYPSHQSGLTYTVLLNEAAPTLTRAAVIALIVLFFLQILTSFDSQVQRVDSASKVAQNAAETAEFAARSAGEISDQLRDQQTELKQRFDALLGAISANQLLLDGGHLIVTLREVATRRDLSDPTRAVFRDIHQDLKSLLEPLFHQLHMPENRELDAPLLSLANLYSTYLKLEALNFEENGGCRFPTRFANYAFAVFRIVSALENQFPGQYEYFTILNRSPRQFFNLESGGADELWALFFLEQFCRGSLAPGIQGSYTRWFVSSKEKSTNPEERIEAPNYLEAKAEYEDSWILCSTGENRPIYYMTKERRAELLTNPGFLAHVNGMQIERVLRHASPHHLTDRMGPLIAQYTKELREGGGKAPQSPSRGAFQGGFIVTDGVTKGSYEDDDLVPEGLSFMELWKALDQYQHPEPQLSMLEFRTLHSYTDFFTQGFPTDFFAVRDLANEKWKLVIGTTFEYFNPMAVTLLYSDEYRQLVAPSWKDLSAKLDRLWSLRTQKDPDILLLPMEEGRIG